MTGFLNTVREHITFFLAKRRRILFSAAIRNVFFIPSETEWAVGVLANPSPPWHCHAIGMHDWLLMVVFKYLGLICIVRACLLKPRYVPLQSGQQLPVEQASIYPSCFVLKTHRGCLIFQAGIFFKLVILGRHRYVCETEKTITKAPELRLWFFHVAVIAFLFFLSRRNTFARCRQCDVLWLSVHFRKSCVLKAFIINYFIKISLK